MEDKKPFETKTNDSSDIVTDEVEMKMPQQTVSPSSTANHSLLGVVIAVLVVLVILVLGGLYMWNSSLLEDINTPVPVERPTPEENNEPESTTAEAQVQTLQTVSTSDELNAIEADIESSDFSDLDAELEAIEAELDEAVTQ